MEMNAIRDGNILSFNCPSCGHRNSTDITEYNPQFLEEIGTYENLSVTCPSCRVQVGFNMALPLFEAAEPPGYFEYASDDEMSLREILRDIMWERMPELQGRDREAEEAAYIEEHRLDEYPVEMPAGPTPTPTPTPPPAPAPEPEADPEPGQESDQILENEPSPEADPEPEAAPGADSEAGQESDQILGSDREEVIQELQEAIEEVIESEEGDKNNG